MTNIVGLGGSIHDFATCLIQDERVIALEDERISRKRYAALSSNPCDASLEYCLGSASLSADDLDVVIGNDDLRGVLTNKKIMSPKWINHHYSHALSTFFTSPFKEAAVLIIDGAGSKRDLNEEDEEAERETTTLAYGSNNHLRIISKTYGDLIGENPLTKSQTIMSNSLGELYRIIAETLELGWLVGPGKAMGLASYGAYNADDRFVSAIMENVELLPEGKFTIKANGKNGLVDKLFRLRQTYRSTKAAFNLDAALAYSGQLVFENILFHLLNYLQEVCPTENLCLAGGVALNSMANGKIALNTKFKNIHVIFAPGDSGTALGSAIKGYIDNALSKELPVRLKITPYLGKEYSSKVIEKTLKDKGIHYTTPSDLLTEVSHLIARGKTVAWYQGGAEFGPRALGNRSILADPRSPTMRDHINFQIKKREWYRPLAPVVIESCASEYFEVQGPSPWMQFVWPVKEKYMNLLPAITHIDGTARVQTVKQEDNPLFFALLEKFYNVAGVPILLNTSFNINGEPIVETPEEALIAFTHSAIDVLAIGDYLVSKV